MTDYKSVIKKLSKKNLSNGLSDDNSNNLNKNNNKLR